MNLTFTPSAWDDYQWFLTHEWKLLKRVNQLIQDALRTPFEGVGKPEPLKYLGSGVWSRRLTQEHRIVYLVGNERVDFLQARYHY